MPNVSLAFISAPGPMEMLIIGVIAVMLFGKRLPEVGRSLGKSFMEFKKGMQGIEDEFRAAAHSTSTSTESTTTSYEVDDYAEATAPKFEPPAGDAMGPDFDAPTSHPTPEPVSAEPPSETRVE